VGPFSSTEANPTHRKTDPTQPNPSQMKNQNPTHDPTQTTRNPDFQSWDPELQSTDPEVQSQDPEIKFTTTSYLYKPARTPIEPTT